MIVEHIWHFLSESTVYLLSIFFVALVLLFIYDRYIQRKHQLLINYPVIGRMRYLFEALREPLRQGLVKGVRTLLVIMGKRHHGELNRKKPTFKTATERSISMWTNISKRSFMCNGDWLLVIGYWEPLCGTHTVSRSYGPTI